MDQAIFSRYELTSSYSDVELLRQFYSDIYVYEFPDPNERESVENMEQYLALKDEGWYGNNNYHILLYLDKGIPVAGAISDYLVKPNAGVIEFLVVKETLRQQGLGTSLLQWTEQVLQEDSRNAEYEGCSCITAEMNDPFKSSADHDSLDPFLRSVIWHRWGYQKVRFPYVQPALSSEQEPVCHLMIICKSGTAEQVKNIPSSLIKDIVFEYARWAMRIDKPEGNAECRDMSDYLLTRSEIDLVSLAEYIGDESVRRLTYTEVTLEQPDELDAALAIYGQEFSEGQLSVSQEYFKNAFLAWRSEKQAFRHHLLSFRSHAAISAQGMASFFTFPVAGFGGYIVFAPELRNKGYLAEAITIIERYMVMDGMDVKGWYCECDPTSGVADIFRRQGFTEVDITYRQPPLASHPVHSIDEAPALLLFYKVLGENFDLPVISRHEFLTAMKWILRVVYTIDDPDKSIFYQQLKRQIEGNDCIGWRQ